MNYDVAIIGLGFYSVGLTLLFIYHLLSYKHKAEQIASDMIAVREKVSNEQVKHYVDTEINKHRREIATWVDDISNSIKKTNGSIVAVNESHKQYNARLLQLEADYESLNSNLNDILKELNDNIDA